MRKWGLNTELFLRSLRLRLQISATPVSYRHLQTSTTVLDVRDFNLRSKEDNEKDRDQEQESVHGHENSPSSWNNLDISMPHLLSSFFNSVFPNFLQVALSILKDYVLLFAEFNLSQSKMTFLSLIGPDTLSLQINLKWNALICVSYLTLCFYLVFQGSGGSARTGQGVGAVRWTFPGRGVLPEGEGRLQQCPDGEVLDEGKR